MPEGPSIIILKEQVQIFKGKEIIEVSGNSKEDIQRLNGLVITDFKSWGKHLLICFRTFTVRVHLMLFGSYRINEHKDAIPRMSLKFKNGGLSFYACSIKIFDETPDEIYDWSEDVMSDRWNPGAASRKLQEQPDTLVCDALLDQRIFAGVGNIIKNEVLFRIKVHPESIVGRLPTKKMNELIKEVRIYCFQFLEWKKNFELKKHWLANTKKICPRDKVPFIKEYLGKTNRRTFYCNICQVFYK